MKKALVVVMRALTRGLIAVIILELSFPMWNIILGLDPHVAITQAFTHYSSMDRLGWIWEERIVLGALTVGIVSSALKVPLWVLFSGVAFCYWAVLLTIGDTLSGLTEWHAWFQPLATTFVAALPTVVYSIVRGAQWVVSRFKKPDPSDTPGN